MANEPDSYWIKQLDAIIKHLDKNEKWLEYPDEKIQEFEKDFDEWNSPILEDVEKLEKWLEDLDKKMEDF
ncbi:hypothetical protein SAMN05216389_106100 [Oceanobacillus limi]|uniref:Uncharacterized protein n=1 Tax=Oceanobacillus limi TaxID=930131 RepID=A0A1I0C8V5_9BACI|nr:hypothetical protein [Oceanobacillus limi]SET15980.1 hypothetical protein SAMN05216389_106100 [Oceanobacillus limi]